mgnify:CR=1 FL=1
MTARRWLNLATIVLMLLILFLARDDLVKAWHLLGQVNPWILLLVLPVQFISYYAGGAMVFSYLKYKGDLKETSNIEATKMALELNFVNHVLPSGGVSGISYMTWRLTKLGVATSRATLAQVVRFAATFGAFLVLLLLSVLLITFDGDINRFTILVSCGLIGVIVLGLVVVGYAIGSKSRIGKLARAVHKAIDWMWHRALRRKTALPQVVSQVSIQHFFDELHEDYISLRRSPDQLKKPLLWGVVFNVSEMALFWVTFLALGTFVNPAPIMIALGLASLAGVFLFTPGGAGGDEALMILFLRSAGVPASVAGAGVLLARVLLIVLTIGSGYLFYHQALKKYGKPDTDGTYRT